MVSEFSSSLSTSLASSDDGRGPIFFFPLFLIRRINIIKTIEISRTRAGIAIHHNGIIVSGAAVATGEYTV